MFGCYRRGEANDPDTYVGAITMVLAHYSAAVVKAVTDPYAGLPSQKKDNGYTGLPDVADVKAACESEAARLERMKTYQQMPRTSFRRLSPPTRGPGAFATVLVKPDSPQFETFRERAAHTGTDGTEWRWDDVTGGIWVAFSWFDGRGLPKPAKTIGELTAEFVECVSRETTTCTAD